MALNAAVQTHVGRIEQHNRDLRDRERAIPAAARGTLSVDAFCALEAVQDIDARLQDAERALAAARSAEAVRDQGEFAPVRVPAFDAAAIDALLVRGLPELDAEAAAFVQAHLAKLGRGGEAWVGEGMTHIVDDTCPFCAQDQGGSRVLGSVLN